ncbi:MAG: DUF1501 domain-containing protein, partial [Planctomycetales bacterium]|nr:DUF1501 domain-containing protein [Planctomycetales bacterium]
MSGGNDGLNTVVPYLDELYRAARPTLALARDSVIRIDDQLALHGSMTGLARLLEDGMLGIVQGVGYDQPNRSHFESMDIWHTCRRKHEPRPAGWLGAFLDSDPKQSGSDVPALHIGNRQQPMALLARNVRVPSIDSVDQFQLRGDNVSLGSLLRNVTPTTAEEANELLGFVQSSTSAAVVASQQVAQAIGEYRTDINYPQSRLGEQLKTVAQLIDAGLKTRIYYVELDGFDTHSKQAPAHSVLLEQWSEAVSAFMRDLVVTGNARRVAVMSFSEFGRRVAENASGGTDHGAAAPMFFCSERLQQPILGKSPDLSHLYDGDLQFQIDFRSVYASVLKQWMD